MRELLDSIDLLLNELSPETTLKITYIKKNQLSNLQEYISKEQLELKYGGKLNNFRLFWPPGFENTNINTKNSMVSLKESFHAMRSTNYNRNLVNSKVIPRDENKDPSFINENYEELLNFSLSEINNKNNEALQQNKKRISMKTLDKFYQEKSLKKQEAGFFRGFFLNVYKYV